MEQVSQQELSLETLLQLFRKSIFYCDLLYDTNTLKFILCYLVMSLHRRHLSMSQFKVKFYVMGFGNFEQNKGLVTTQRWYIWAQTQKLQK